MKYLSILFLIIVVSCSEKEEELYDFIDICQDEFYASYGINLEDSLLEFEAKLIEHQLLRDKSFEAYQDLLFELESENKFNDYPFSIPSNSALLVLNPKNLKECIGNRYAIDSVQLSALNYYKLQKDLSNYYASTETVGVGGVFRRYKRHIKKEDFSSIFVRKEILKLFYRWYYESEKNGDL